MMKLTKLNLIALTVVAPSMLISCGKKLQKEDTNPDANSDKVTVTEGASLTEDQDATDEAINSQVDEAISAVSEQSLGQSASLSLYGRANLAERESSRECVESDDGQVVVSLSRTFDRQVDWNGAFFEGSLAVHREGKLTRTWSQEGSDLNCGSQAKFFSMPWDNLAGLNLDVTLEGSRSREGTRTNKRTGKTLEGTINLSGSGTRHFEIISAEANDEGDLEILKTVESNVDRTLVIDTTNKKATYSLNMKTKDENPLSIQVTRDGSTHKWKKSIVQSGIVQGTGKEGGMIEISFQDVVYTSKGLCSAESGTITGIVYDTAGEIKRTFEIDFGEQTHEINFEDGRKTELVMSGCGLEK